MKTRHTALASAAATGALLLAAASAQAAPYYADYSAAIVTSRGNCLLPDARRGLYVYPCSAGGAIYSIVNGQIRTRDDYCFDHGVVRGTNPGVDARHVKLVKCAKGNQSQVWYYVTGGKHANKFQNAVNPDVCLNLEGESDRPGTRLLVWSCGFDNPHGTAKAHESFYLGGKLSSTQIAQVPQSTIAALNGGAVGLYPNGLRLVAAGGGNLVAAGGGNLVAAGGGNLVAAGGGNLVAAGGGNLVATLIGNDGSTLRATANLFRP